MTQLFKITTFIVFLIFLSGCFGNGEGYGLVPQAEKAGAGSGFYELQAGYTCRLSGYTPVPSYRRRIQVVEGKIVLSGDACSNETQELSADKVQFSRQSAVAIYENSIFEFLAAAPSYAENAAIVETYCREVGNKFEFVIDYVASSSARKMRALFEKEVKEFSITSASFGGTKATFSTENFDFILELNVNNPRKGELVGDLSLLNGHEARCWSKL